MMSISLKGHQSAKSIDGGKCQSDINCLAFGDNFQCVKKDNTSTNAVGYCSCKLNYLWLDKNKTCVASLERGENINVSMAQSIGYFIIY